MLGFFRAVESSRVGWLLLLLQQQLLQRYPKRAAAVHRSQRPLQQLLLLQLQRSRLTLPVHQPLSHYSY